MKYSSFATLAALFAVITLTSSPATMAVAKTESAPTSAKMSAAPAASAQAPELYAQAASFNDPRSVRLDAQLMAPSNSSEASSLKAADDHAPLNLWALVVAGMAVMGSLAFRRSPNK